MISFNQRCDFCAADKRMLDGLPTQAIRFMRLIMPEARGF